MGAVACRNLYLDPGAGLWRVWQKEAEVVGLRYPAVFQNSPRHVLHHFPGPPKVRFFVTLPGPLCKLLGRVPKVLVFLIPKASIAYSREGAQKMLAKSTKTIN